MAVLFHGIGNRDPGCAGPHWLPTLSEGAIGMLVVETIAKIRRAYFSLGKPILGKPIKEICRELRVSRKVVRKVIRSNATEFRYERSRQPLPRIGPWQDRLDALLDENENRSARERLTIIRYMRNCAALVTKAAMPPSGVTRSPGASGI